MQITGGNIILCVNGKEQTFTESELIKIVAGHIHYKISSCSPNMEIPFPVNPLSIDRSLFENARPDSQQEQARQKILQALIKSDQYPDYYNRFFFTVRPRVSYTINIIEERRKNFDKRDGYLANDMELGLEWAQRLTNGETWEELCNTPDSLEVGSLVCFYEENRYRLAGGNKKPATCIYWDDKRGDKFTHATPLLIYRTHIR